MLSPAREHDFWGSDRSASILFESLWSKFRCVFLNHRSLKNESKNMRNMCKKVWSKLDAFWMRYFDLLGFFWGSPGTSWEGVLPLVGLLGTLRGHPGAADRPILASNKSPKWTSERKWSELGSSLHRLKASGRHFGGCRDPFWYLQELFLSLQTRILEPPMIKLMISYAGCKNAYRLSAIKARRNARSD